MQNNEIIDKWKKSLINDKNSLKKLSKLTDLEDNHPFFTKLFFDSKKIIARLGLGYGKFNKLTIELIAYSFGEIMKKKNTNKNKIDILVCSDGSPELKDFLKNIANVFYAQNLIITAFKSFAGYDKKFISRTINKLNLSGGIFIERSIYNNDIFNMYFIDSNGHNFNGEIIREIQLETNKHDIFSIKSKLSKIDFLSNNKMINDYTQKILSLSNRKGDQRKMKIAISNYNNGVTEILKKILGNMDFNYTINNKINKNNINLEKNRNEKTFVNFYKKDVLFARRNKCDMLICPSRNGSALNLFVFNGRHVVYLDSNEITLMFLNFFLKDINTKNQKISNWYIGTDIPPIKSIKNLINKYQIELSVSEDIKISQEKYLLFYWNQNSHFIFGENLTTEFGFHHLIVRFLEMINYHKTQRLNIVSERNILAKMYGSYKTHIVILNFELSKLYWFLENINESDLNYKYPVENVVMFEQSNFLSENLIAKILFKNGEELLIKFNYYNNKIVIFTRVEHENYKIWKKEHFVQHSFVNNVAKLITKNLKKVF